MFFTLSRTGIILLITAFGIQLIINDNKKNKFLTLFIFIIASLTLLFLSDQIVTILKTIIPSIKQGTDTIGLRYDIWQGGWRMWMDNIIFGVGIGRFPEKIAFYAPGMHYSYITAHNTYLNMLAETGIVGFLLFMLLLIFTLKNFLEKRKTEDNLSDSLQNLWLSVFLVILISSLTMTVEYHKLLWFLIGISVYFHKQANIITHKK